MKLTYDQCDEIMDKDKKNWVDFCENEHGSCFWNQITGQIIWRGDECNISDPKNHKKLVSLKKGNLTIDGIKV